jgi:hydrogenase nickel incorporation protein HypA/HybF
MDVIRLASAEAEKNDASLIYEIEIELGELSGVELEAFKFSLELLARESILSQAEIKIHRISGKAKCGSCGTEFEMHDLLTACPQCGEYKAEIMSGKDFRIKSLLAE